MPPLADEILALARALLSELRGAGDIDVLPERLAEAERDVGAIVQDQLLDEARLDFEAQRLMRRGRQDPSRYAQVRHDVATTHGIVAGEAGFERMVQQVLDLFLMGESVDEVFTEDTALHDKLAAFLKGRLPDARQLAQDVGATFDTPLTGVEILEG
jgi:hypothetical protein